jgi:hypothetical protein
VPYLLNCIYLLLILFSLPWLVWQAVRKGKYREGYAVKFLGRVPMRAEDTYTTKNDLGDSRGNTPSPPAPLPKGEGSCRAGRLPDRKVLQGRRSGNAILPSRRPDSHTLMIAHT